MSAPHILCAFRNSTVRERLARHLEKGGFHAEVESDAPAVIQAAASGSPDLLLCDGRFGSAAKDLALLQAVRGAGEAAARIPAIVFTSREPSAEFREQAEHLRARIVTARRVPGEALRALVAGELQAVHAEREGELLSLFERVRSGNPFEALGVEPDASSKAIERAYKALARRIHPDAQRDAGAEVRRLAREAFADLAAAYLKLSDAESLARYREQPDFDERQAAVHAETRQIVDAERCFADAEKALERRDWQAALSDYERAVALCPDEGEYRACLGWAIYLAKGGGPREIAVALKHARAAVKLSPNHHRPRLILGRLYQMDDDLARAEKQFERAVELKPDSIEATRELRIMRMRHEARPRKKKRGLLARVLR